MVQRVEAPAEHYLLTQGSNLTMRFGQETLSKFAVQKLLEHKLTSRNFKAGLDFSDHYKAQRAREKLGKMVLLHIEKELKFLWADGLTAKPFVGKSWSRSDQLVIHTFYDLAISRYVGRINRAMNAIGIPLSLSVAPFLGEDRMEISIMPTSNNRSAMNYYRLMFFLPQMTQMFKCLSKKALFNDESTKSINRSKRSGYVAPRPAVRNRGNAATASPAPNRSGNAAGTRPNVSFDSTTATNFNSTYATITTHTI